MVEKKDAVETLAKELLKKEVLFQSDVEALIGARPFGDHHHSENGKEQTEEEAHPTGAISAGVPPYDSSITTPAPKQAAEQEL